MMYSFYTFQKLENVKKGDNQFLTVLIIYQNKIFKTTDDNKISWSAKFCLEIILPF